MENRSSRLVIILVSLAAIFIILFGVQASASIVNPILLALVITITVLPVPSRLTKRGMPGWLALVLTILMVVLLLGLVIFTIFFSVTKLTTELPQYLNSATQEAAEVSEGISNTIIQVGPVITGLLSRLIGLLTQFGIALFIFFFMISAAISLPAPNRLGLNPNAPGIMRISELTEGVRRYMTVLTGVNFLVALGNTIFLMILGVDFAVLWGLLSWFMGYIPSIGFIIALIPPALMALAQFGWETALVVIVGYIIINGGVQNFLQPKMMGNRLHISPVVVFIGLFIWGYLLGGIGALLAVPLTLLVITFFENFEGTRDLMVLVRYTGEGKGDKEQRGQAMDQVRGWMERIKTTFRGGT